jgi:murein DD-endopeptidase MepM/ murein hydrolase activator NlpD
VKRLAFFFIALFIISIPLGLLFLSGRTQLSFKAPVTAIGQETPVTIHISNPAGTTELHAYLEQNGKKYQVFSETKPGSRFFFWRKHYPQRDVVMPVGKKEAPAIADGKARLVIEAKSNDMRSQVDTLAQDVEIITSPPRVVADGEQHYLNTGGSELVVFTPSGYWTDSGVIVDRYKFRSFPMPGSAPGSASQRFSLFAYPWDLPDGIRPKVYATNLAGAEAEATFWFKLFPKKFRTREIEIDDKFLDRVVNQIDPKGSGDLLQRFLKINGELRKKNNQTLADLRLKSEPKLLWSGPFLQLGNSKVEAVFADDRTYVYKKQKVDRQVHLGFDLAVNAHTPIPASNDGKVVWASDLGIYGNCVVIDHGYGLQSIYGHLSEIGVKTDQMVKRGEIIGKSGATGLAGGDHLHYGMQVDGVQVNPIEWWDAHWIHDRVLSKLNGSVSSQSGAKPASPSRQGAKKAAKRRRG